MANPIWFMSAGEVITLVFPPGFFLCLCSEIPPIAPAWLLAVQVFITPVTAIHLHTGHKYPTTIFFLLKKSKEFIVPKEPSSGMQWEY